MPEEESASERTVFISYQHADRAFVQALDASLRLAGATTLLDEKDVRVGDSIPQWIYAGISEATHLIYVMSTASVKSRWVAEELDIAKVREKEDHGFRVLPVLIEDELELPVSVRHIKHADYRGWTDPARYAAATVDLLRALDLAPLRISDTVFAWWARNYAKLAPIIRNIFQGATVIEAGMSYWQWFNFKKWATKYAVVELDINHSIEHLITLLEDAPAEDELLSVVRQAVAAVGKVRPTEHDDENHRHYTQTAHLAAVLVELDNRMTGVLVSIIDAGRVFE